MSATSIYDNPLFFSAYQKQRENPISHNEIVEIPAMLSLLPDLNGKRLLDLGCGTGVHLSRYLERGLAEACGLDLSEKMLAEAQNRLVTQAPNAQISLKQGAMQDCDALFDAPFDLITSSYAFHYIADFADLLRKIHGLLAPNGVLIFSQEHPITTSFREGKRWEKNAERQQTAYRLNFYRDEGARARNWFQQPFTTYHRTFATLINNLIQAGFEVENVLEPMLADAPEWHAEFKDLQHRPAICVIRARKKA